MRPRRLLTVAVVALACARGDGSGGSATDTTGGGRPSSGATAAVAGQGPATYVDRGACPFECCTYGPWRADSSVTLSDAPDSAASELATIAAGSVVTAVTGEVHVRPGKFVLERGARAYSISRTAPPVPADTFMAGDTLGVYTYRGEGAWKVRKWGSDKELVELMLAEPGTGCERDNRCDGRFLDKPVSSWWVQIRTGQGVQGWTTNVGAFAGKDRCSGDVVAPPRPGR
jgi:hypothetical protein